MKIQYLGVVVGDMSPDGLIQEISEKRLTDVAKDVLINGIEMPEFAFLEEHKGEAGVRHILWKDDEYPLALWYHLQALGYDVEDFPVDIEKASGRFVGMGHLFTASIPYGAKKYEPIIAQQIKNTLKYAVAKGIAKFKPGMTKAEMDALFQKTIDKWLDNILSLLKPIAWSLMQTGLVGQGLDEQQYSNAHKLAMDYLEEHPHSILNAVKTLGSDQKQAASDVLDRVFKGEVQWDLKKVKAEIMEKADVGSSRAELIARTEMTKISNMGRIMAWEQDPLREDYDYHYIPTRDSRTKAVSIELANGGPYTFEQIKALWLNPVSPTTGENDVFNNRCGLGRTRKRSL